MQIQHIHNHAQAYYQHHMQEKSHYHYTNTLT